MEARARAVRDGVVEMDRLRAEPEMLDAGREEESDGARAERDARRGREEESDGAR